MGVDVVIVFGKRFLGPLWVVLLILGRLLTPWRTVRVRHCAHFNGSQWPTLQTLFDANEHGEYTSITISSTKP
jgi:hypothetical protein